MKTLFVLVFLSVNIFQSLKCQDTSISRLQPINRDPANPVQQTTAIPPSLFASQPKITLPENAASLIDPRSNVESDKLVLDARQVNPQQPTANGNQVPGTTPVAPGTTPMAPGTTPMAPGATPMTPGAIPNQFPQGQMIPQQQTTIPQQFPQNQQFIPNQGLPNTVFPQQVPNNFGGQTIPGTQFPVSPTNGLALNSNEAQQTYAYVLAQLSEMLNNPIMRNGLIALMDLIRRLLSYPNSAAVLQEVSRAIDGGLLNQIMTPNTQQRFYNPNQNFMPYQQQSGSGSIFDAIKRKAGIFVNLLKDVTNAKINAVNSALGNTPLSPVANVGTQAVDGAMSSLLGPGRSGAPMNFFQG